MFSVLYLNTEHHLSAWDMKLTDVITLNICTFIFRRAHHLDIYDKTWQVVGEEKQ